MADQRPIFSKQQVQDTLRTRDAIKEISKSMKTMGMDTSNVADDFKKINTAANGFALAQEKARKNTNSVTDLLTKGNELIGRANKLTAEINKKEIDRQKNVRAIQDLYKKLGDTSNKATAAQKAAMRDQIKGKEALNVELQRESQSLLDAADHTRSLGGNFKTLASTSVELSQNVYGIAAGLSEQLGISKNITSAFENANEIQRERKMIILEEQDLVSNLELAYEDYVKEAKEAAVSFDDFKEGLDEAGLSAERLSRFNLEGITEGAEGAEAATKIKGREDALKNTRTGLPSALTTMLKPLAKFGTIATVLAKAMEFLRYALFGVEQETIDLARTFSLSREEAKALRKDIGQMANDIGLSAANAEDLVKFQIEFTKHTGFSTRLNREQFKTITLMTKQLGFSNDEAINMVESFKAAGISTEEGFNGLMKSYNAMKLQGKATTTFKALMGDITKDAELQRIYLTQGADAAMRNAQAQRRTGLSLSMQRSMAEGTLDFEKTMTDQLELQLLTGKDINLLEAQKLALQGKNGQAVAAMQKEMGKLTAKQKENPIIMNKMLGILNMSREQYYEMLNAQQLQAKAQKEEKRILEDLKDTTGIFHTAKTATFKSELDFIKTLKGKRKEEAEDELLNYRNTREYQEDIAELKKQGVEDKLLAETAFNNKINKFSEEQIQNARIRAGYVEGELSSFGNLRTTSEAFGDAMARLKGQFANLVNQGVIEDLTTMLVDFVQRVSEVGLGSAILGGGAEEVAQRQSEELLAKAKTDEEREEIRRLLDQATTSTGEMLTKYASYGSLTGGVGYRANLAMNQEAAQLRLSQMAEKANTVEDFILRPGEPPIKFNKGDLLMGGTQLGTGGGKVEQLLEQLLAETKAGKVIKMDTATVARSLQLNATKMSY